MFFVVFGCFTQTEWDLIHKLDPAVTEIDNSQTKRPRTGSGKRRPLTAKYTWDIHGHRVPSAKIKAYDDSYLDRVPRRSFLKYRRSPSPTSSEEESAHHPPPRPPPPPPKAPTPPPAVERPSSKHKQRTIINMPSERIRDEVKGTKRSPRKYETSSQTDRHLLDDYDHNEEEVKAGPWGEYQIYVRTGDRIGASSAADVNITIYGEKGRTPPIKLATSKHNKIKFQKGKEDLFIVAAHHVGKMRKVKIGHDRPQLSYAWYLESVTIYDMDDKRIYDFPCEQWLSGQDDDQRTYRVLPVDRQRAFVDALEKPATKQSRSRKSHSDSESSDTEYESSTQKKDKASMRAKRSHRSRADSSSSSETSATSESESEDEAVVRMSAPPTPKEKKKEAAGREEEGQKSPGTVIQFKKKGSQKVEEEVVLNERNREPKPQQEFLAGYKAGVEAVEATERKQKEDERTRDRQLLSGASIHDACRNGDLRRVKELLDKFPEMKDFKDESGWTPLHLAAANGHVNIIKWLTSAGRDDIDVETPTGYTPTHVAAMNGHISALMVLNAMGAHIGCKTVDKQTPLHLAARAGHLDCVKWLAANRGDLLAEDSFGRTALYLAQEYGQSTVADFLRVCERDLADPNSTFAQMHRAQQGRGSAGLHTIKEDDKNSMGSDPVQTGSSSTGDRRRAKERQQRELQEKRQAYDDQHQRMEAQGVSFLDSIRQDFESEV
ncbi:hypothetical protein ACOMHN_039513 [Nucella lapillus]